MCDPLPLKGQPINLSKRVGLQASNNLTPTFLARLHLDSIQKNNHKRRIFFPRSTSTAEFVVGTVRVVRNWWNRVMASIKSLF